MEAIDVTFVVLYFLVIFGIALWAYSRQCHGPSSADNYFLADRCVPWWVVGLSLFTSNIGSEHLIGLSQTGLLCEEGMGREGLKNLGNKPATTI